MGKAVSKTKKIIFGIWIDSPYFAEIENRKIWLQKAELSSCAGGLVLAHMVFVYKACLGACWKNLWNFGGMGVCIWKIFWFFNFFISEQGVCGYDTGAINTGRSCFLGAPRLFKLGWQTRLERATPGTTIQCSNQLSYCHHFWKSNIENFIGLFVKALLEIFIFLFQIFRKVLVSSELSCVLQGAEAGITHLQIWIWKIFKCSSNADCVEYLHE